MAFGDTGILDNFNRADEGPPPSSSWTDLVSGLVVTSNACGPSGPGNRSSYWNVFTAIDAEVFCTIASNPANNRNITLFVRLQDIGSGTTDGYAIRFNKLSGTDTLELGTFTNGTFSALGAAFSQELTAGNKFGMSIEGTTLTAYVDTGSGWTSLGTRTDSTYSSGGNIGADVASGTIDDFGGGDISGGATYTLTAEQGSFSLAGQTAGLLVSRLLTAVFGSFTLTGQDAGLLTSRLLIAEQGSFVLSGQGANLLVSRLLTAEQGSFALTGQAANLLVSRLLTAAQGSFVLSGQDATLTYNPAGGYTLTAEAGTFTLSGQAANLLTSRLLTAAQGSFALSGQNANLIISRLLTAEQGSITLTGQDANLLVSRLLTAVYASFVLSGQAVTFDYSGLVVQIYTADVFVQLSPSVALAANVSPDESLLTNPLTSRAITANLLPDESLTANPSAAREVNSG